MKAKGKTAGKPNRTRKGNVTATARQKFGDKENRFPIFDATSAGSAIKLRGHAKNPTERATIVNRAAKYQPAMAKQARQRDRKRSTGK